MLDCSALTLTHFLNCELKHFPLVSSSSLTAWLFKTSVCIFLCVCVYQDACRWLHCITGYRNSKMFKTRGTDHTCRDECFRGKSQLIFSWQCFWPKWETSNIIKDPASRRRHWEVPSTGMSVGEGNKGVSACRGKNHDNRVSFVGQYPETS